MESKHDLDRTTNTLASCWNAELYIGKLNSVKMCIIHIPEIGKKKIQIFRKYFTFNKKCVKYSFFLLDNRTYYYIVLPVPPKKKCTSNFLFVYYTKYRFLNASVVRENVIQGKIFPHQKKISLKIRKERKIVGYSYSREEKKRGIDILHTNTYQ